MYADEFDDDDNVGMVYPFASFTDDIKYQKMVHGQKSKHHGLRIIIKNHMRLS